MTKCNSNLFSPFLFWFFPLIILMVPIPAGLAPLRSSWQNGFLFLFWVFLFLAVPGNLWDLSSLTRDWTQAPALQVPSPSLWTIRGFPRNGSQETSWTTWVCDLTNVHWVSPCAGWYTRRPYPEFPFFLTSAPQNRHFNVFSLLYRWGDYGRNMFGVTREG